MSYFKLPVSLCKRIQTVITRYWWDNTEGVKKMAWISWDRMAKSKSVGGLGMRDFLKFNKALLAKISWRLLDKPDCLLGKILKGKYFPESHILLVEEASSISHGWRSILIGRNLLLKNLGWAIGDGLSINIWQDPWLSMSKQERPMGPPTEQSAELSVADLMIADTRQWDRAKIRLCLRSSISGAPDKLFWLGTKSGDYTSKSGYFAAIDSEEAIEELEANFNWKKHVWNLQCAPKVKQFSWRLLKRAIPVGERLVERHIDAEPKCKRCGENESITHLLFHCQFAHKIWFLAPLATDVDPRGIIDLMASWPSLCSLTCLPPSGVTNGTLVPWILWTIRKARNKLIFEGFSASPEETLSSAIGLAREWATSCKTEPLNLPGRSHQRPTTPDGAVIVQTDAAWSAINNVAGLGWAIVAPAPTQAFQERVEFVNSPLMAEGLAMREAVFTCRRLELKVLQVESDSAQLVKCVTSSFQVAELHSVVSDILYVVDEFESISFAWNP